MQFSLNLVTEQLSYFQRTEHTQLFSLANELPFFWKWNEKNTWNQNSNKFFRPKKIPKFTLNDGSILRMCGRSKHIPKTKANWVNGTIWNRRSVLTVDCCSRHWKCGYGWTERRNDPPESLLPNPLELHVPIFRPGPSAGHQGDAYELEWRTEQQAAATARCSSTQPLPQLALRDPIDTPAK